MRGKEILWKKIAIATALLGAGIFFGLYIGTIPPPESIVQNSLDLSSNFLLIFLRNLITCLIIIGGSGIITVPVVLLQGGFIGFISALMASSTQSTRYLLLLIPHGIIEIPALIISAALGLKMFKTAKEFINGHRSAIRCYCDENRVWLILVPILLLIAAMVESYVTPQIFNALWEGL
jgi:stage II sporulation protein M